MAVLDQNVAIFRIFEEFSAIPHGSFNEKGIADYIENFAISHNLKYVRDSMHNVVIYKDATAGYEDHEPVMLQGHTDMVCEKNNDTDFDFEKDGLNLYVDDGWLKAKGTTLGADDGVAVAQMLVILESDTLKHPALECVFTVQEEVGLIGAMYLKADYFKSKRMIGLDGGGEVSTCTTSSGGRFNFVEKKLEWIDNTKPTYELFITGLKGGHSGGCIHMELGNSIKIAFRVMQHLTRNEIQYNLVDVNGGLKENAIPRECIIQFSSDASYEKLQALIKEMQKIMFTELEFSDPDISITLKEIEMASKCMSETISNEIVNIFFLAPNGLMHKSMAIKDLTYSSLNLGKVRVEEDLLKASFCIRSPLESMKDEVSLQIQMAAKINNAISYDSNNFGGWSYEVNSPLRDALKEVLAKQGIEMETTASHGGMETGIMKALIPELDIITYGPISFGCHTPEEKLDLESFKRSYQNLCNLLEIL